MARSSRSSYVRAMRAGAAVKGGERMCVIPVKVHGAYWSGGGDGGGGAGHCGARQQTSSVEFLSVRPSAGPRRAEGADVWSVAPLLLLSLRGALLLAEENTVAVWLLRAGGRVPTTPPGLSLSGGMCV